METLGWVMILVFAGVWIVGLVVLHRMLTPPDADELRGRATAAEYFRSQGEAVAPRGAVSDPIAPRGELSPAPTRAGELSRSSEDR